MLNTGMPVVLSPVVPLMKEDDKGFIGVKQVEETKGLNAADVFDDTPFIQAIVSVAEDWDVTIKTPHVRLKTVQFSL